MGASSSKSIIAPSGAAGFRVPEVPYGALLKVQERDNMAFGRIFKRMIENITPKELRELYSINQCKKYHFALGNALAKIFYFTPVQGMAKGAQPIYWLRLDSAKKEEYTPEFFKNCFQVAYFYIRLLQIFCALSISTKSNEVMPYSGGPYGGPMGQFFRMPGFSGGGDRDDDTIRDVLRTYLDDDNKFRGFSDRMKFIDGTVILEKQDVNIEAELSYDPKKERISIKNYTYNGRLMDEEIRNRYSALFYIGVKWVKDKGYFTKDGYQISGTLHNRLLDIKNKFKETKEKKKGADGEYVRGAPPAERRELRVEYLVDRLSGSANKPYAIARALQLIDLVPHETYTAFDPYGRGKKTYGFTTHVFDFNYSAIIGNAPAILSSQQLKDLQEQNNTLANVLGLSALEKLYFDKWDESSADGKGSESYRFKPTNETEYQNFLKALECMYKSTSIVKKETISSIRSFTIDNVHKTEKGPKTLKIENDADKAKITALKKIQAQLFGLQMTHNARVKQFIQQSIIADTPRGPMPNPRIFREGISFINTIGVDARRLLLDYYVKAEAIYNQGYMLIKTGSMTNSNLYAECSKFMSVK
jgi:hypothetical protein